MAKCYDRLLVKIEVQGGVAYCTECPDEVDVIIIDHDNLETDKGENNA